MSTDLQMFSRRQFLQLAGSTVSLLALSACQSVSPSASPAPAAEEAEAPSDQGAQAGGTLRIAISDPIASLDPGVFNNIAEIYLGYMTYNNLVRRAEGEPGTPLTPELAEAWELSDDALTMTFHLRQGVTFHHGLAFTAEDVVHSIERLLDPTLGTTLGKALSSLDRVEAVDDHTVQFLMKTPNVTLPFVLSGPGFQIVPHDQSNEELAVAPSGTGPFRFVEHLPGERLALERFDDYWEDGQPYLDEVLLLTLPESANQIAALTSGTVDLVVRIGIENLPVLEGTPGVQVVESLQGLYPLFAMDVSQPPFDDVRVRQALKHSIDRTGLQQAILQGRGMILNDQPIVPGSAFSADIAPLAYDVEKAKALLAEAGYGDGVEVTLSLAEVVPGISDAAVAIQEMAKAAGITLNLETVPMGTFWSERYMQAPFFVSFWNSNSDPDGQLSLAYSSDGPFNESRWAEPEVDEIVIQARGEGDTAKRAALYAQIQEKISHEGGVIIPYMMPIFMAASENVQGLIAQDPPRLQDVWLAADN